MASIAGWAEKRSQNTAFLFVVTASIVLSFRSDIAAQDQSQVRERILTRADSVSSLPSQKNRWALLIGVDKYEDSNISPLSGAANDANSLREVLIKYAGFPQDQVVVLSTDEPPERQPTRNNILKRLSNLSGLLPNTGLLLFSFAGHGIERNGQAFLIPSDASLTEDVGLLEDTAVSVTQIKKRIKDTTVKQVMIFLDACRSYPTGRSGSSNPLTPGFTRAFDFDLNNHEVTAFAVLYATAVGHRAYEYTEKHQGYFSWAIARGLSGAAANIKGEVTLRALVKYLEDNVPKLVALDYGAKVIQKPFADIEGFRADELILSLAFAIGGTTSILPGEDRSQPPGMRPSDTSNVGDRTGKVLLSRSYLSNEMDKANSAVADDEFLTPLIQALQRVNLNVTSEWTLDEKSRREIGSAVFEIKQSKAPVRSTQFVVNVETILSVKDLPAYGELKIAVANVTLRAIDLSSGEIAAVENLEARGFGNEQSQARINALKEASQQIPKGFINQVVARATTSSK